MDLKKTEEKTINILQGVGEGFLVMVIKRAIPKTKFNRIIFFDSFRDVIRRGRK